jgi:asparagine synthase (glutamine-hydrolysing)
MDRIPLFARGTLSALADRLPYSTYGKNFLRMMSRPSALERYFESNSASYFLRRNLLQPDWPVPPGEAFLREAFPECIPPDSAGILSPGYVFRMHRQAHGRHADEGGSDVDG